MYEGDVIVLILDPFISCIVCPNPYRWASTTGKAVPAKTKDSKEGELRLSNMEMSIMTNPAVILVFHSSLPSSDCSFWYLKMMSAHEALLLMNGTLFFFLCMIQKQEVLLQISLSKLLFSTRLPLNSQFLRQKVLCSGWNLLNKRVLSSGSQKHTHRVEDTSAVSCTRDVPCLRISDQFAMNFLPSSLFYSAPRLIQLFEVRCNSIYSGNSFILSHHALMEGKKERGCM